MSDEPKFKVVLCKSANGSHVDAGHERQLIEDMSDLKRYEDCYYVAQEAKRHMLKYLKAGVGIVVNDVGGWSTTEDWHSCEVVYDPSNGSKPKPNTIEYLVSYYDVNPAVPLQDADVHDHKGWVYDRDFGVFVMKSGCIHEGFMAGLEELKQGKDSGYCIVHDLVGDFSESFLKREGTAFKSSVGSSVKAWDETRLNTQEKLFFRKRGLMFTYLG